MHKWQPLAVLATAQFLMVLDQAVMNVAISQLVEDFDTTVTTIQGVITMYSLVMATLMLTGGKLGDILGRRRVFAAGLVVYGTGSALTAASGSVPVLLLGWSVLEGIGAAMVLPALVALVAATYGGRDRVTAFGVIGGVAGAGIAVGPIVGGWFTTEASWRWVFVGEVVLALLILAGTRILPAARPTGERPHLDVVGAVLSILGLGAIVLGTLRASTWGWIEPKDSPVEPFGFSLTPFVIAAGLAVMAGFVAWERHRERRGRDPLVELDLLNIPALRSGLSSFLAQNTVLLGIFFVLPLYLQIVLGFSALDTGIRMLPISVAMFLTSTAGPRMATRIAPRRIVQGGFVVIVLAALGMLATIEADFRGAAFGAVLALLGIGMGLIASQLGNVVQSSVEGAHRSEAGGLQFTAQQFGAAVGTALIGAVVISALVTSFLQAVDDRPEFDEAARSGVAVAVTGEVSFVSAEQVGAGARALGFDEAESAVLVEDYESAQLRALRSGLLLAATIAAGALLATRRLPGAPLGTAAGD